MRFKRIQPDNPILRREILHQERTVPRWLRSLELVGPIVLVSILSLYLTSMALTVDQYSLLSLPPRYYTLQVAQLAVWGIHAATALRAFFEGATATRRSASEQEWDTLVLTGISARRIFIGQWWAAMYRIRGWIVALGIIQMTIVPVFMAEHLIYAYAEETIAVSGCFQSNTTSYYCSSHRLFNGEMLWETWVVPVNVAAALGLSLFAAGTYSLIGMTLVVLLRQPMVAVVVGSLLRFTPAIVFSTFPDYSNASGDLFWRWWEYNWFVIADGGTSALIRMTNTNSDAILRGVFILLAAIIMFTMISTIALAVLLISLQHKGASPPYI